MNFYDFHIGDYASRTAHLEPMEDLAYRRLLDLYYVREEALPHELDRLSKLIRLRGHEDVIETVLEEFFTLDEERGWVHSKCEEVIAAAQKKRASAQASANKRWGGCDGNADAMRTHSDGTPSAKQPDSEGNAPSPTSQSQSQRKPPKSPKGEVSGFAEFYEAYPRKTARPRAAKAFAKAVESASLEVMLTALDWQKRSKDWTKDGGKWIPHPATWLNDERWKDERPTSRENEENWFDTRSGVERKAAEFGIKPWNEMEEHWPQYRQRVMKAVKGESGPALSLDQLAAMAQQRMAA